jgi:hypothetical protein
MIMGGIEDSVLCLAMAVAADLSMIKYKRRIMPKGETEPALFDAERRPYWDEVEVYSFPQTWSSTALGFGGIGGQAMTVAQTTVCVCGNEAAVYFGRRLAYKVDKVSIGFMNDVRNHNMADRQSANKYRNGENNEKK